ncbi:MAG: hypothetical protein E6Q97_05535 [Desulfurellales bacterium]|nr:MAG: hypothetical protein E6Q97_05535 [Desulfurellales bacterium]
MQPLIANPVRYAFSYSFGYTQAQDNAAKCRAMFDAAARELARKITDWSEREGYIALKGDV